MGEPWAPYAQHRTMDNPRATASKFCVAHDVCFYLPMGRPWVTCDVWYLASVAEGSLMTERIVAYRLVMSHR